VPSKSNYLKKRDKMSRFLFTHQGIYYQNLKHVSVFQCILDSKDGALIEQKLSQKIKKTGLKAGFFKGKSVI